MTEQSKAAGIGVDKPYITAYSAIDEQQFLDPIPLAKRSQFRRENDIPADAVVLVTIARLFMLKGHDYIIESARELAKRFDKVVWLFVGNGNLADQYQQQVRDLGDWPARCPRRCSAADRPSRSMWMERARWSMRIRGGSSSPRTSRN